MGKFATFGAAFFLAYYASYLMLWARASRLRRSVEPTALPDTFSLFWGSAALGYLWSGRHRKADDTRLTQIVLATRITQLLLPVGILFFLSGA